LGRGRRWCSLISCRALIVLPPLLPLLLIVLLPFLTLLLTLLLALLRRPLLVVRLLLSRGRGRRLGENDGRHAPGFILGLERKARGILGLERKARGAMGRSQACKAGKDGARGQQTPKLVHLHRCVSYGDAKVRAGAARRTPAIQNERPRPGFGCIIFWPCRRNSR
jgi:hypothetical protein